MDEESDSGWRRAPELPTNAGDAGEVQAVAEGTLAMEGAVSVDTATISAGARILPALIHICRVETQCLVQRSLSRFQGNLWTPKLANPCRAETEGRGS